MSAGQLQRRRGSNTLMAAFTGAQGEFAFNTTTNRLHTHDGATPGGHPHALLSDIVVSVVDSGTTNTIVVNSNVGPTALVDTLLLSINVKQANTSAVTINYNSAGAVPLVAGSGAALVSGALQAGMQVLAWYIAALGTFVLLSRDGGMPQFPAALPINQGGTGGTTAAAALAALGGVSVSGGTAGKVPLTNSAGDLDASFLPNGSVIPGVTPFTGYYNILNALNATGLNSSVPNSNARQYFHPFSVYAPTLISQLGMNVVTGSAGTTFSCAVYADNGGSGGFSAPLISSNPLCSVSGLSSAAAGLIMGSVGTSITIEPGIRYWVSYAFSSVAATFSAVPTSAAMQTGANASGFIFNLYLPTTGSTLLAPLTGTFTGNQATRLAVYQG